MSKDDTGRVSLRSERLAEELARSRLSQNAWARRLGLSKAYLSQLVTGRRRHPSAPVRRKLLEVLELEFDELFELEIPERSSAPERPSPLERSSPPERPSSPDRIDADTARDDRDSGGTGTGRRDRGDALLQVRAGRFRLTVRRDPRPARSGRDDSTHRRRENRPVQALWQDVRYGARMLRKRPVFTLVAVLTLALGIGANTMIFALVNAVFFTPVPVRGIDELVAIYGTAETRQAGLTHYSISFPKYEELRDRNDSLSGLAAFAFLQLALADRGEAETLPGQIVTGDYFEVLGVEAAVGRTLRPDDDRTLGAHPVAVLSHELWEQRYAADPGIVGRQVRLNGHPFTVVGVAEPGFTGTNALFGPRVWVPLAMHPQVFEFSRFVDERRWRIFNVVGRLAPGKTPAQAQRDLTAVTAALAEQYPDAWEGRGIEVMSLAEAAVDPNQRELFVQAGGLMFAVVLLVLLITCANVGNLMLARARGRRQEIAVRLSLGAGRWRLARQLLSESLLLALLGGVAAVGLTVWGRDLLLAFRPPQLPDTLDVGIDAGVLAFNFAVALAAGLTFGLVPALQGTGGDLASVLRDQRSSRPGTGRPSSRDLLVVAQVALSFVAVAGAGLFLASLDRAQRIDPGFDPGGLLLVGFDLGSQGYEPGPAEQFRRQLLERTAGLPSVTSASLAQVPPLTGFGLLRTTLVEGREDPDDAVLIRTNAVSLGYFETMGLSILRGRGFGPQDRADSRPVVVVNDVMAARLWPDQQPLGRRIRFQGNETWYEVVGVVETMRYVTLGEDPQPYFYHPLSQRPSAGLTLFARTDLEAGAIAGEVRRIFQELDPNLPLDDLRPAGEAITESLWGPRTAASLLSIFGGLALVLAAVGIYGVLVQLVSRRTREIGIRMALGAARGEVLALVARQTLGWVGLGLATGLAVYLAAGRWTTSLLYGVSPGDPLTLLGATTVLAVTALLASLVPARRASRVDPMVALRDE